MKSALWQRRPQRHHQRLPPASLIVGSFPAAALQRTRKRPLLEQYAFLRTDMAPVGRQLLPVFSGCRD